MRPAGTWAYREADNRRIELARLRLLRGRPIEQVERCHLAALAAVVPHTARCSMRLRDRRYLDALLAEMARYELPEVESAGPLGYASCETEHSLRGAM